MLGISENEKVNMCSATVLLLLCLIKYL